MPQAPGSAPAPQEKQQLAPEQIDDVIGEGLLALGKMLEGKPQLQDRIAEMFQELQQIVSGGGEEEPMEEKGPPAGAPASMNQGGNPNAQAAM